MGSTSLTRDQTLGPLHWEHGALATGPPGKSPRDHVLYQGSTMPFRNYKKQEGPPPPQPGRTMVHGIKTTRRPQKIRRERDASIRAGTVEHTGRSETNTSLAKGPAVAV